jgi:DNA (cytosine-5)-methyltransferase 1
MSKGRFHIELFAGCGGMSLGLDAAGFELYFANELSPMAGETFSYNLLDEDLDELSKRELKSNKTLWIKSNYPSNKLSNRLRENPFLAKSGTFSDLEPNVDLEKKLLVGDIDSLLDWLNENPATVKNLQDKNITLLSGGPPCQSFSLAGRREKNNAKNLLPLSFSRFAGLIKPKIVLLENVKGITSAFVEDGIRYHAWFEVSKAFALEGFVPICMLLNSKYFGVAQNRPRFILLALRIDIAKKLLEKWPEEHLLKSLKFYNLVNENRENLTAVGLNSLDYYDIESSKYKALYNGFVFPKITNPEGEFISAAEAIGDLKKIDRAVPSSKSRVVYRDLINRTFSSGGIQLNLFNNHEAREHSYKVKARFRLYQVINEFKNGNKKNATDFLTGKDLDNISSEKLLGEFSGHELYLKNGSKDGYYKKLERDEDIQNHLLAIQTRKHSQQALKEDEPAPAQLTIPDDICHYDMAQLRTLTVREMARFQSFPDWFTFRSKVTTGGENRKFEVPQYTQVGNAVPPLLAKALGEAIINILEEVEN